MVQDELMHYGVLGMHWGKRQSKAEVAAYRKKAANVANNQYAQASDRKRARYASKSAADRIGSTAAKFVAQKVISDVLTGKLSRYSTMSKSDIAKEVGKIAGKTALTVVEKDALAKSAMKNYDNKGKTVPGTKRSQKLITKEDAMEVGLHIGIGAAQVGAFVGGMKLSKVASERKANQDRFNAWGPNILAQTVDHVVWQNDTMSVIDNRR